MVCQDLHTVIINLVDGFKALLVQWGHHGSLFDEGGMASESIDDVGRLGRRAGICSRFTENRSKSVKVIANEPPFHRYISSVSTEAGGKDFTIFLGL